MKNQYFSLLLATMQLVAMTSVATSPETFSSSAISPELMLLALLALTEITKDSAECDQKKLRDAFGLKTSLEYTTLKESWKAIDMNTLKFAGIVLGASCETKPFPECLRKQFHCGPMSSAEEAKTFVFAQTGSSLSIPDNMDMVMAWVCAFQGSWAHKKQAVNFKGHRVEGFGVSVSNQMTLDTPEAKGVILEMKNDVSAIYIMPQTDECNFLHMLDLIYDGNWKKKCVSVTAPNINMSTKINILEKLNLGGLQTSEGRLDMFDSTTKVKIDNTGVTASAQVRYGATRGSGPSSEAWNVDSAFWFFVQDNKTGKILFVLNYGFADLKTQLDNLPRLQTELNAREQGPDRRGSLPVLYEQKNTATDASSKKTDDLSLPEEDDQFDVSLLDVSVIEAEYKEDEIGENVPEFNRTGNIRTFKVRLYQHLRVKFSNKHHTEHCKYKLVHKTPGEEDYSEEFVINAKVDKFYDVYFGNGAGADELCLINKNKEVMLKICLQYSDVKAPAESPAQGCRSYVPPSTLRGQMHTVPNVVHSPKRTKIDHEKWVSEWHCNCCKINMGVLEARYQCAVCTNHDLCLDCLRSWKPGKESFTPKCMFDKI